MDLNAEIKKCEDQIAKMETEIEEKKNWLKLLKKSLRGYQSLLVTAREIQEAKPKP